MSLDAPAPGVMALRPSRILTFWVAFALASVAALSIYYLPLWAAVCFGVAALASATAALRVHALRSHPDATVALRCLVNGIDCQARTGQWSSCRVLPGALVSYWCTVVRVREDGVTAKAKYLVLLPDSIEPEDYRRLRVLLRWVRTDEKGVDV